MKKLTLGMGIVLALGLMGCGGDDEGGGGGSEGTLNETSAKQAGTSNITTVTSLTASTDPMQGQTAANSLVGNSLAAQSAVQPKIEAALLLQKAMNGGMAEGTCDCSGTSCTFTDCGGENQGQGMATLNGTIDWTGGNVVADLTYDIESTAGGFSTTTEINVETDLTVTETSISGSASSNGSVEVSGTQGAGSYSWSNSMEYIDVVLAGGQATGGTLSFTGSYTIAGKKYSNSAEIALP